MAEDAESSQLSSPAETDLLQVLQRHDFDGAIAVSGGRFDGASYRSEEVWPWASVTKQIMAVLVMQEVEAGTIDLDKPVSTYLASWPLDQFDAPSLRQLLRHQSGLYDPEDDDGFVWENARPLDPRICVERRNRAPGGSFNYSNCDTLWVGRVLEEVTGTDLPGLFRERIAEPLGMEQAGFAGPELKLARSADGTSALEISFYGASGGLVGTPADLLKFDQALINGTLLSDAARAEMWRGDPTLGYTALGQWDVAVPLAGCEGTVRVIERRGAIQGYQARNFIFPDLDIAMVVFIGRSEADFPFGEPWSGNGLSYDLLSATACKR